MHRVTRVLMHRQSFCLIVVLGFLASCGSTQEGSYHRATLLSRRVGYVLGPGQSYADIKFQRDVQTSLLSDAWDVVNENGETLPASTVIFRPYKEDRFRFEMCLQGICMEGETHSIRESAPPRQGAIRGIIQEPEYLSGSWATFQPGTSTLGPALSLEFHRRRLDGLGSMDSEWFLQPRAVISARLAANKVPAK